MSTLEIKDEIAKKLATIEDSSYLKKVLTYIDDLKNSHNSSNLSKRQIDELDKRSANYLAGNEETIKEIVAFTINGTPISKQEYIKRNQQAVNSFKKGNFKTQGEILAKYKKSI